MGRKQSRAGRKGLDKLLYQSMAALLLGAALVAVPRVLPHSTVAEVVGEGGDVPAAIAFALGAALLVLRSFLRSRRRPDQGYRPDSTSWAPPETLKRNDPGFADAYVPPSTVRTRRVTRDKTQLRRPEAWSQKVLDEIGWHRFDAVCKELFAQGGFEMQTESIGAGGGLVLWLQSRSLPGAATVVQCRHSRAPLGLEDVHELFGLMNSRKLKRGTFVTNAGFTAEALQFAQRHGINAMDRDRLLALISKRTAPQQQRLLEIASKDD
jgi:restriction system protein